MDIATLTFGVFIGTVPTGAALAAGYVWAWRRHRRAASTQKPYPAPTNQELTKVATATDAALAAMRQQLTALQTHVEHQAWFHALMMRLFGVEGQPLTDDEIRRLLGYVTGRDTEVIRSEVTALAAVLANGGLVRLLNQAQLPAWQAAIDPSPVVGIVHGPAAEDCGQLEQRVPGATLVPASVGPALPAGSLFDPTTTGEQRTIASLGAQLAGLVTADGKLAPEGLKLLWDYYWLILPHGLTLWSRDPMQPTQTMFAGLEQRVATQLGLKPAATLEERFPLYQETEEWADWVASLHESIAAAAEEPNGTESGDGAKEYEV